MKFDILRFFANLSRIFNFRENRTITKVTLHEDQYTFLSYLANFFLELDTLQRNVIEKIKTHFVFSSFFFFENRAVYDNM
jgi:hypothetical protein